MTDHFPKSSVWRSFAEHASDIVFHALHKPTLLERMIVRQQLRPLQLMPTPTTLWLRSVVLWDEWLVSYMPHETYRIDYLMPDHTGHFQTVALYIPEAETLILEEVLEEYTCDISEITGMSASSDYDKDILDIDIFPVHTCREYINPITIQKLRENMGHHGIRLDLMRFSNYSWTPGMYWNNPDGSHHLSAARYLATRLNVRVPLKGRLLRYTVDGPSFARLRRKWSMFLLSSDSVSGPFREAMRKFQCPFGLSCLPENMHIGNGDYQLNVVWLERNHSKASIVAALLKKSGFPDFNLLMEEQLK